MLKCKPTSRSPRPQNKWWRVDFKSEAGITLVELLAVLALLSIIIALVGSAHMFGQKQYRKQAAIASQSNELTIGLATMTRELRNLKANQVEVKEGAILIDGTDIRDMTRDSLRQSFGMVLQETWLFGSSLRANLCYGREDATDEEIYTALKEAHMYDFVMRLPDKLETQVGAHALKISEGQRQLLTIARTMISQPDMLILDEATSSVDTLTEQKISQAFLKMMTGRTSFVIAHRLSTIKNADKILVLNQGQIVEIGSHDQLMAQQGYYYQLQQAQFAK